MTRGDEIRSEQVAEGEAEAESFTRNTMSHCTLEEVEGVEREARNSAPTIDHRKMAPIPPPIITAARRSRAMINGFSVIKPPRAT